ncbi:MAG TPA: MSMEG_0569 family flavin-dependent oxidoreductase [Polyangia bacterium]
MADGKGNGALKLGDRRKVVVIGGGQAGLATSYCLTARGIDHVVLERHQIGHEWRARRWDSFCLVTPNWQCRLPGFPYNGGDPKGFMVKEDILRYIEDYVRFFGPPVIEGASVTQLRANPTGGFDLSSNVGECHADQVVIATGGYHIPEIPRLGERLPERVTQLHSSAYRNPQSLPEGEVLVVGTGQSGCQIAEDLHIAGRRVHLCVGSAPRTARRYRGRDVVEWLEDLGYYSLSVDQHPLKEKVRAKSNHYVTGRDGGRDIDLRLRAREGMQLHGRLINIRGERLEFATDLKHNLDQADAVAESIKTTIDKMISERGVDAPMEARYVPLWEPVDEPLSLDLAAAGVTSVIWSTGYRADYRWIEVPIFDGRGYPVHHRGVTSASGLFFVGLPWQHTWGSGRFSGVAVDAEYVADGIQRRLGEKAAPRRQALNELALGT